MFHLIFEFLLEPVIDTYFFGCPDSCIVPNSDTHELLKLLFTPLVLIGISIGAVIGSLFALGRMPNLESLRSIRGKSVDQMIKDLPETTDKVVNGKHEPKTIKQFERAIRKNDKREFLKNLKNDLNTELAFDKFLEFQDPDHPQTETLKAVRTETKEQAKQEAEQEFYKNNKESLEKQAKQVAELMKSENLTEEEAIDKIIAEMPTEEPIDKIIAEMPTGEVVEEKEEEKELDMDIDVFQQDVTPEEEPKHFKFFHSQFKKKKKKQKQKYKYKLTELGSKRRDEYAKQIEYKLHEWCMPMPKYEGKNQEYQMEEGLLKAELMKLSLFISMCEMIADRQKSKKNYWQKFKLVQ